MLPSRVARGRARPGVLLSALTALTLLASPRIASSQDAISLFTQGRALAERGRWAEACPLFAEAHRLQPMAVGITINLADCHEHTGKTASAWSAYREGEFLAKKASDEERARYAHDHAAALEPRLSRMRIVAEPTPRLIVRRNDQEIGTGILGTSFPVDPGLHQIEATAPGYEVWSTTVLIGNERDEKTVAVPTLGKLPAGGEGGSAGAFQWTGQRVAGLGVGIAGVAGLAVGGVLGGLAMAKNDASKAQCKPGEPNLCSASDVSARKTAGTLADASTGMLIAGGVVAAAGVVVFVTGAPKGGGGKSGGVRWIEVSPRVGSGMAGVGIRGAW